jgi:hypothetical protein
MPRARKVRGSVFCAQAHDGLRAHFGSGSIRHIGSSLFFATPVHFAIPERGCGIGQKIAKQIQIKLSFAPPRTTRSRGPRSRSSSPAAEGAFRNSLGCSDGQGRFDDDVIAGPQHVGDAVDGGQELRRSGRLVSSIGVGTAIGVGVPEPDAPVGQRGIRCPISTRLSAASGFGLVISGLSPKAAHSPSASCQKCRERVGRECQRCGLSGMAAGEQLLRSMPAVRGVTPFKGRQHRRHPDSIPPLCSRSED